MKTLRANKKAHQQLTQKRFLSLQAQGGSKVHNDQIAKAIISALLKKEANQETIKFIMAQS